MQKREKILLIVIISLIIILEGVYIFLQQKFSGSGRDYIAIYEKIQNLKVENLILHEKILDESSFLYLSKMASSEGFINQTVTYLPK